VSPHGEHRLRVGELSRRVGLSPEVLRAWERRYGVLRPERTAGGLRLYSADDERRIRTMNELLEQGVSTAEAARSVLASEPAPATTEARTAAEPLEAEAESLASALARFDAEGANETLDRLLASFTLDTVLARIVIPYLRELGELWERGEATVGHEHFASNLLRARLMSLARGWGQGTGPLALLACAPGERHDIPLVIFGLALRERGWRITYLGADTPGESLAEAVAEIQPDLVVVTAVRRRHFTAAGGDLAAIAARGRLAIAGEGARTALADELGCELLEGDPVSAAAAVAEPSGATR
jgi:MerR family transcriptional regulator, light-induced transcriptional regulator